MASAEYEQAFDDDARTKLATMSESGQIVTFYSYKGGTGRTMSVANIACLLARRLGQSLPSDDILDHINVVAIDWDFEAPGLHRYFLPFLSAEARLAFPSAPGLIDLISEINLQHRTRFSTDSFSNRAAAKRLLEEIDFDRFLIHTTVPGLAIIKSGRIDPEYPRLVNTFNWEDFFLGTEGFFQGFADYLRDRFQYTLIDSRTGVTDTSGICTALLPDKLVVPFTPNSQSLSGIEDVVRRAVNYRRQSEDWRPLAVFPLPSRIDISRPSLAEEWRNGSLDEEDRSDASDVVPERRLGYQRIFERMFTDLYGAESGTLQNYFDEVVLQHVPDYVFGEPIAVEN